MSTSLMVMLAMCAARLDQHNDGMLIVAAESVNAVGTIMHHLDLGMDLVQNEAAISCLTGQLPHLHHKQAAPDNAGSGCLPVT